MYYDFIEQANKEPDLKDVVTYLIPALSNIEELISKFEKISLKSKTNIENMVLYQEIDKITHHYLPLLINKYCEFSLQYRNKNIIKTIKKNNQTINCTAKDLLLQDIAKIIEEINIIENKFNDINKFDFLVSNRIISNLGNQSTLYSLDKECEVESISLENKFNYDTFSKDQLNIMFTKPSNTIQLPINSSAESTKNISPDNLQKDIQSEDKLDQDTIFAMLFFPIGAVFLAWALFSGNLGKDKEKISKTPISHTQPQSQITNIPYIPPNNENNKKIN